jgi:hypothetical protein
MNSLDRAFLKAYAKQTVGGDCYQRLDAAHGDAESAASRLHTCFSAPTAPPPQPSHASASRKMTSVFQTPDDPHEAPSFSPIGKWTSSRGRTSVDACSMPSAATSAMWASS